MPSVVPWVVQVVPLVLQGLDTLRHDDSTGEVLGGLLLALSTFLVNPAGEYIKYSTHNLNLNPNLNLDLNPNLNPNLNLDSKPEPKFESEPEFELKT